MEGMPPRPLDGKILSHVICGLKQGQPALFRIFFIFILDVHNEVGSKIVGFTMDI